jgi:HEAT repeat protein
MEPFTIASMLAIAGKLVTTEVTKAAVAGVKRQLQPDKMALVLKESIESAQAKQPEIGGIFFRCQEKAAAGFLEQFFQSTEVLKELQKPIQDDGKPDVDVLVAAFDRSAKQYLGMQDYIPDTLRSWLETFVDSYFEQLQGICFQVAKEQYLQQLARRVDDVKFVGIAVPGEEVEKQEVLAQIFVMPDVREEKSRNSARLSSEISIPLGTERIKQDILLVEQREWATRDRSVPRIPAQKVINLARKKAVVLGAPGSGKTMLASYFALMLCQTTQSDPTQIGLKAEDDYLPLVVRIRDWILQPNMGLLEYLRSNAEASLACKELPAGFFEHWLERGRALILLDGLDEVVDEALRRKVAEQIETFLHQYKDNPAVITSRPAGYRWDFFNLDEFPHYTLESFDDKQVAMFIDHWYDSRLKEDPPQAERRKADLQKAFARNERIKLLAKNPLLLTIITLIHRYGGELPRQRYKLYEKAVETLLTSWDSGKEIKLYSQVLLFLKSDDLLYILKKLAYWIHTKGSTGETEGGTLIDKDELIRWLRKEIQTLKKCAFHEAKDEAKRFIDFIQRRTGLLNEQGRDRYAFVHKTFQEYLTAEEIFDLADEDDNTEIILDHFRKRLHDQHWREVLLLLVSKLNGKKAQKAIQAVLDAGSEYEQWLHRDLLFAGWCLIEDPPKLTGVAADFVGEILDRLVELEVEKSDRIGSKISDEVEKILTCFGETTIEQYVWAKLQAQGEWIDRFQLLKFQAALGQEADAIASILSLLKASESDVRGSAASVLGRLRNSSAEVLSALLPLLGDPEWSVRRSAASALGQLGNSSAEVVNGLLPLLGDPKWSVRRSAASALGQLGNSSAEVVSAVLSLLGDPEWSVRDSAASALVQLGNSSAEVVSGLLSLLGDPEWSVRRSAASALGQLGNSSAVSAVLSLLGDLESHVRISAASALVQLGNSSAEVVSALLSLLGDPESDVRRSAASALVQLGNSSAEVVSVLLSLLGDPEWYVRDSAASALGQLGNSSAEVVSALLSLLDDPKSDVRGSAALALVQLGNSSAEVVSALLPLLGDSESDVRRSAATALGQLAKISDSIRPVVVQLLEKNPNYELIGNAIDCLWSIV